MKSFFYKNGLSIFSLGFFLIFLGAQALTGWNEYNHELIEAGGASIQFFPYLSTGHFVETTFENWESEFLQMFLYVLITVKLRQVGSSESKKLIGPEEVDREPIAHPNAPWPVKRGGMILLIYKNSLSLAFFVLFLLCFIFHAMGSYDAYNVEQSLKNKVVESFIQYLGDSKFWFESFQNWQSEFLAIASIVVLSVFLRQQSSPESKPVDMPNGENP